MKQMKNRVLVALLVTSMGAGTAMPVFAQGSDAAAGEVLVTAESVQDVAGELSSEEAATNETVDNQTPEGTSESGAGIEQDAQQSDNSAEMEEQQEATVDENVQQDSDEQSEKAQQTEEVAAPTEETTEEQPVQEEELDTLSAFDLTAQEAVEGRWRQSGSKWWFELKAGGYLKSGAYEIGKYVYYFDASGWMLTNSWQKETTKDNDTIWYYYGASGAQTRGWLAIGGVWYFFDPDDGSMNSDGWYEINGKTYFFKESGAMYTGWYKYTYQNKTWDWYYYGADGVEARGWKNISGTWYYFDTEDGWMYYGYSHRKIGNQFYQFRDSGAMVTGWYKRVWDDGTFNWYYYDANGVEQRGWHLISGKWYYLSESTGNNGYYGGWMYVGRKYQINNETYAFDANGVMLTGWYKENATYKLANGTIIPWTDWFYFDPSGAIHKGWLTVGGVTYYMGTSGYMSQACSKYGLDGIRIIDGATYGFDDSGAMIKGWSTRVITFSNQDGTKVDGTRKIYFDADGKMHFGWLNSNGKWYYMEDWSGAAVCRSTTEPKDTGRRIIGSNIYLFDEDGVMLTGWVRDVPGYNAAGEIVVYLTYYMDASGAAHKGWLQTSDGWYYFNESYADMYKNGTYQIDDKWYKFDENGRWIP